MRGLAGGCLLALVLRAAIVTVQADSPNNVSLPVFYKVHLEDLKILRATAYTLLIQVPSCRQSCNTVNVKFKIKTSSSVSWWAPKDVRIHPSHNDTYNIGGLLPDTLYSVRAFISPPGTYTKTLVTYTCPERPAPVRGLRVAGAGPGWLDVRWAPPAREVCVSDVEYETRYRPRGGLSTPLRVYGAVPGRRQGFVQMRPAHPCPSWPREFCLLLVDAVLPGRNHTVEVQVHRVDGRRQEKAAVQSVEGYADPRPLTWGPDEGAPGARGPPSSGAPPRGRRALLVRRLPRGARAAPRLLRGRPRPPAQRAAVARAGAWREHIRAGGAGAPVAPVAPVAHAAPQIAAPRLRGGRAVGAAAAALRRRLAPPRRPPSAALTTQHHSDRPSPLSPPTTTVTTHQYFYHPPTLSSPTNTFTTHQHFHHPPTLSPPTNTFTTHQQLHHPSPHIITHYHFHHPSSHSPPITTFTTHHHFHHPSPLSPPITTFTTHHNFHHPSQLSPPITTLFTHHQSVLPPPL